MPDVPSLLDPPLLRRLDTLRLVPRRPVTGQAGGARRSLRRGASVEFADFREYAPGDDLRSVDWKAYGRLEKLYLKLFVDEEDLGLHLLVDTSASMAFGNPPKLLFAQRLVAALGYVALSRADHVAVTAVGAGAFAPLSGLRGRAGLGPLLTHLGRLGASGTGHPASALARYAASARGSGIAIVLSDFYDDGWAAGLQALRARRFQVVLAHILSPEEAHSELAGEVRLRDSESGDAQEVSLSPSLLAAYAERLRSFCDGWQLAARRYDMTYVRLETSEPLLEAVRRFAGPGGILV